MALIQKIRKSQNATLARLVSRLCQSRHPYRGFHRALRDPLAGPLQRSSYESPDTDGLPSFFDMSLPAPNVNCVEHGGIIPKFSILSRGILRWSATCLKNIEDCTIAAIRAARRRFAAFAWNVSIISLKSWSFARIKTVHFINGGLRVRTPSDFSPTLDNRGQNR